MLKSRLRITVFILLFLIWPSFAFAALLPVPRGSSLVKRENIESGSEVKEVSIYETRLRADEVISFYKREMTKRGYSTFLQGTQHTIFMKGKEMLVLVINPSAEGKTQFILTTASTDFSSAMPQACVDIPSVPAYPGASCLRSVKMSRAHSVNYMTKDSIGQVLAFYQNVMPQKMWQLEREINTGELLPQSAPQQNALGLNLDFSNTKQIIFKNFRGAKCMIMVMNSPMGTGSLINIVYDENPKY